MQQISLIFLKKNDPLGCLIKFVTKGQYSHVALLFHENLIADTDMIRKYDIRSFPWQTGEYDRINLCVTNSQYVRLIDYINSHIGAKYSLWENFRWILKYGKDDTSKLNCVEALVDALNSAGIVKLNESISYSPDELWHLFMTNKKT